MYFTKNALVALALAAARLAVATTPGAPPVLAEVEAEVEAEIHARAPIPSFKVGWGQELQNHDQANHWVVWVEGESACPAAIELAKLVDSPCGQSFNLKGQQLSLADCSGNEPRSVHGSDGSKVLTCGSNSKNGRKITCHGNQHDIVQHGYCQ